MQISIIIFVVNWITIKVFKQLKSISNSIYYQFYNCNIFDKYDFSNIDVNSIIIIKYVYVLIINLSL